MAEPQGEVAGSDGGEVVGRGVGTWSEASQPNRCTCQTGGLWLSVDPVICTYLERLACAPPSQILGRGFHDPEFWAKFDETISKLTTRWCCRSPKDQVRTSPCGMAHHPGEVFLF